MLNTYCRNVLKTELAKSDYDGMTADQAWAWLTQPVPGVTTSRPSGLVLTPLTVAALIGPAKAEVIAAALIAQFPVIGAHLMDSGVDPLNQSTQAFFAALVAGNAITQGNMDALVAYGTITTTGPAGPPRFGVRFDPRAWPHVTPNGDPGNVNDLAISGFPNTLDRADFDLAFAAAGRS